MIVFLDLLLIEQLDLFTLLVQPHHFLLLEFAFGVLILDVLLLPLEIVNLGDELLVLAHDAFVVGFVELDVLLELFLEALHGGLEVGPLLDELLLLVDALHLLFAFFLNVFAIDLDDLRLESLIVLSSEIVTWM